MTNVLLTGGTGYIGTHTAVSLIESGLSPVLLDNFTNSSAKVIERIERIAAVRPELVALDVRDTAGLASVLKEYRIEAVIHFAALKAVGESLDRPIDYYDNNVGGLVSLLDAMRRAQVGRLVVSSSATVYGNAVPVPYREDAEGLAPTSPYGWTKLMMERIVQDVGRTEGGPSFVVLRYFNPVGAHPSGLIGEQPVGTPNNLMPYLQQVATGLREKLFIFGGDYPTQDGTGERDYIHVMDLARGHLLATRHLLCGAPSITLNLGSGRPVSVLGMVHAFERVCGRKIPYEIIARRPGDIAAFFADPECAQRVLDFRTQFSLDDMCRDAWRWQSANANGYD